MSDACSVAAKGLRGRPGVDDLAVRADAITKRFDQAVAVDHVSLDVYRGEFLSFL
jgi:ABC-type sugar transport system ATPase subunit